MRHSILIVVTIFMFIPIFLSVCQGGPSPAESRPSVVEEPTQESISIIESPAVPTHDSATITAAEGSPNVVPTPRQGFESTDPSRVVLASGKTDVA